jgi:HD-like signal output (HDOD) protein
MQENGLSPLAEQTVQRVVLSLGTHDAVPAINQILEVIRDLSSKAESLQIAELGDAITKDVSLSAKVLMAANTIHFNHHGTKVTTITEAIQRIGLKQIRNLAVTLLLIGPLQDETQKLELKQITSVALMSGLAAQLIAKKAGFKSPEQALICASMRHYGRILIMNFLLDEYRYIHKLAETIPVADAYLQILGIGVMELGYRVAEEMNLSSVILQCMEAVPPEFLKSPPEEEEAQLQVVSAFSMELCELIEDGPQETAAFNEKLAELARRYEPSLKTTYSSIDQLIRQSQGELDRFQALYQLKPLTSPFISRMHIVTKRSGYTVLESKAIEPDLTSWGAFY